MKAFLAILFLFSFCNTTAQAQETSSLRVAMVAQNEGTEITDLLVPFAVLSEAGIEVEVFSTTKGSVTLWPEFQLEGLRSIAAANPSSFDLLIVPAVLNPEDPDLLDFIKSFAATGGITASVCDGVNVLAETGLLEGRQATGHFYSFKQRQKSFPGIDWVRAQRYVRDGNIITTAGVSASSAVSVYLVEQLLGPQAAANVAKTFNIEADPSHDTTQFKFGLSDGLTMLGNGTKGIFKRKYVIAAGTKLDEYSLAYSVDILARTSQARLGFGEGIESVTTRNGLRLTGRPMENHDVVMILPGSNSAQVDNDLQRIDIKQPGTAVSTLLNHVDEKYGKNTVKFVTKQLEMPWPIH